MSDDRERKYQWREEDIVLLSTTSTLEHGDFPGHPFRGNQYAPGEGFSGEGELKIDDPKMIEQSRPIAKEFLKKAIEIEKEATPTVVSVAMKNGGKTEGMQFKIKSENSLTEKVARRTIQANMEGRKVTPEDIIKGINDINRYTITYPKEVYTEKVKASLYDLQQQGWRVESDKEAKNYWTKGKTDYKGFNVILHKGDRKFELQFHTPESYNHKEHIHPVFEEFRTSTDKKQRWILLRQMRDETARVEVPVGFENLPGVRAAHAGSYT